MEISDVEAALEAILFASGEPLPAERIAAVLAVPKEMVLGAASHLADTYGFGRRGIRLVRLDDSLQLCSSPEYADYIRLALETRKPPQLSQPAMEVLAIIAYYQPVTRVYIEQVRGVDSSYTVGLLCERGLIETCGRLAVPGRPALYRTTRDFLRVFSISSLEELPELPEEEMDADGQMRIQSAIDALRADEAAQSVAEGPEGGSAEV